MNYRKPMIQLFQDFNSLYLHTQGTGIPVIPECNDSCGAASLGYICEPDTSTLLVYYTLAGSTVESCDNLLRNKPACDVIVDFAQGGGSNIRA
ncbi:MAG: hypothetical protein Q8Q33_06505, partial [Chlamydiota bacterium]|nr:hypothetical protein [Chlamydiota bacterium]